MVPGSVDTPTAPTERLWLPTDREYTTDKLGWLLERREGLYFKTDSGILATENLAAKRCLGDTLSRPNFYSERICRHYSSKLK